MSTAFTSRRRSLVTMAAGVVVAGLLAACSSGSSGTGGTDETPAGTEYNKPAADITATLTISNWGDPNDKAVYDEVDKRFKAKYPNVTVTNNFTPITTWTEYVNKVTADVAAGNAPDVINIAIEGLRLGASKNLFSSLNGYLANDPEAAAITGDVDPALLASLAVEDDQYLLPSTWNTMLIYYNTKMFEAAGIERPSDDWTWDDFKTVARQLTTGSGSSKVFGFAVPYFNFGLTPWLYSNGTSQLNEDWTASNLTDPKVQESVEFVRDLVKDGVAPEPKGADPYQLFPAEKVAMTGAGHWVVGSFDAAGFKDYDVLPWPQGTTKGTVFGTAGYGIAPSSENKDLAWEYIKELVGAETQAAWVEIGAATPASTSAAQSEEFLAFPPSANLYHDAIEYAKPVAAPTVFNTLEPSFMRAMDSILAGEDPAAALKKASDEVEAAFADQ